MTSSWHELMENDGRVPEWPYPIRYEQEQEIETDVLVIGGGIAGCWAALSEARTKGVRVAGATGVNTRTGEFMIFKARAIILATAGIGSVWVFNTELAGISTFRSRNASGDGTVMAYRAGAEVTMMEKSGFLFLGTGYRHKIDSAGNDPVFENVPSVDDNGKALTASTASRELCRSDLLKTF